jgi:hypothetical protein
MNPLAGLFRELWGIFLDAGIIDGSELQELIERTGLAAWRPATQEDVDGSNVDLEVGDPILCLTEEGKRLVAESREAAT